MSSIARINESCTAVAPIAPAHGRRAEDAVRTEPPVTEAGRFDGVPAEPPHEVMAEVAAAFDRLDGLHEQGLSVRFDVGEGSPLRVHVVDAEADVRRQVPASEALRIVAGERPALPADPGSGAVAGRLLTFDQEA